MALETKVGKVDWESLKEDLMQLPKEKLIEIIDVWIRNYGTSLDYWTAFVEREYGTEVASRIESDVSKRAIRVQAYRLKKALGLGDDMQALAFILKHTAQQWVPGGTDWEFVEISEQAVKTRVAECPMGKYRKEHNLELLPCKTASPPVITALAKVINPKMVAHCTHAYPDAPKEGVMCEWEFVYED